MLLYIKDVFARASNYGKTTYGARMITYAYASLIVVVHHTENNLSLGWLEYCSLAIVQVLPHMLFVHYVNNNNSKKLAVSHIILDVFGVGWIIGLVNLSLFPSCLFFIAGISVYLVSNGLKRLYSLLLLLLGASIPLALDGFYIHLEFTNLIMAMSVIYALLHFVPTSLISYYYARNFYKNNKLLKLKNIEIAGHKEELLLKTEELKALNNSLNNVNNSLEKKVQQRTEELEIKNAKLADYAFINSHRLRSPVASILGLINLIGAHSVTEEDKEEILQKLKVNAEKLDAVVKHIRSTLEKEGLVK